MEFLQGIEAFSSPGFMPLSAALISRFVIMVVLLVCSGLISGSEIALFSLSPAQFKQIRNTGSGVDLVLLKLLEKPKRLLATVLIANNLINVAIIILWTLIAEQWIDFGANTLMAFVVNVIVVTFLLLLFGEVIPKVYAGKEPLPFARIMARPLLALRIVLEPLNKILIQGTGFVEKRLQRYREDFSVEKLSHALDLTNDEDATESERKILKGIVKFGNIDVEEVMTPRVDVFALSDQLNFEEVKAEIKQAGYSRVPVYSETLDKISGILYIKDLLGDLDKPATYSWTEKLRTPFFVPEGKKINELLKEIKEKKTHLALVVDEYGGTSGLITLEDIIEEIVGEISDEFDDEENPYFSKIAENVYVFQGKTPLNEFFKALEIDPRKFDTIRGEAQTLGGLLIEIAGKIPYQQETIAFENYRFTVLSASKRKINSIKVLRFDS
jgi:gliding motility-associated protein GldE